MLCDYAPLPHSFVLLILDNVAVPLLFKSIYCPGEPNLETNTTPQKTNHTFVPTLYLYCNIVADGSAVGPQLQQVFGQLVSVLLAAGLRVSCALASWARPWVHPRTDQGGGSTSWAD